MKALQLGALVAALASSGCYRILYYDLAPPEVPPPTQSVEAERRRELGWRNFYVFGWLPGEKVIDAAERCGGVEHVRSIRTRQTFAQGLVSTLLLDMVSPRTALVTCDHYPLPR